MMKTPVVIDLATLESPDVEWSIAPGRIEESRQKFAALAIACALECSTNAELIQKLEEALPEGFLALIGTGSTRRTYTCPLGIALKVQRESVWDDPLSNAEMEERGGSSYALRLEGRRCAANLSELIFAIAHPRLMPQQYGFLGSFGIPKTHPSILIAETARPLDLYFPNDGKGIATTDIGVDPEGYLRLFDPRITAKKRPDDFSPWEQRAGESEPTIWLGNLGVVPAGKYVFIDRSDHGTAWNLMSEITFCPKSWGWTFKGTKQQTLDFSESLFRLYEDAHFAKKGESHG